jgi:hypothetical protein
LEEEDFCMSELRPGEIAIRQDLFNGLVDELTDALGWLLVIHEEDPRVLQNACGKLDARQRLAQMSAVLSGRTFDKRYHVAECGLETSDYSSLEEAEAAACSSRSDQSVASDDLTSGKQAVEENKDEDTRNPRG